MITGKAIAYFDGACEPRNPGGNMGIGSCIYIGDTEVFTYSHFVSKHRDNSNNVAEYMGFEAILDWLLKNADRDFQIDIFGDSKLVVMQMKGAWRIKAGRYVEYAMRCKKKVEELKQLRNVRFKINWIPREQNHYADKLSKAEMIKHKVQFKIQPV